MSTNLFNFEFKKLFKSTLFWMIFINFLIIIDMVIYREMMESGMFDKVLDMMDNPFIGNMMKGFGINPEQFTDVLGFYAIRNTMVTMLAGSLFAVIKSASLISLEESEKTSEFLMSRPITRIEVMNAKLLSFHSNLLILNVSTSFIGFLSLEIFKYSDYNLFSYFVLCVNTYLLTVIFGSIGLFFSLLVKRGRVFMGALIGMVIGSYFIEVISNVTESANFIGYISPFKYANKDVLKPGYGFELWKLIVFICGSGILTFMSYKIFSKKDIF